MWLIDWLLDWSEWSWSFSSFVRLIDWSVKWLLQWIIPELFSPVLQVRGIQFRPWWTHKTTVNLDRTFVFAPPLHTTSPAQMTAALIVTAAVPEEITTRGGRSVEIGVGAPCTGRGAGIAAIAVADRPFVTGSLAHPFYAIRDILLRHSRTCATRGIVRRRPRPWPCPRPEPAWKVVRRAFSPSNCSCVISRTRVCRWCSCRGRWCRREWPGEIIMARGPEWSPIEGLDVWGCSSAFCFGSGGIFFLEIQTENTFLFARLPGLVPRGEMMAGSFELAKIFYSITSDFDDLTKFFILDVNVNWNFEACFFVDQHESVLPVSCSSGCTADVWSDIRAIPGLRVGSSTAKSINQSINFSLT